MSLKVNSLNTIIKAIPIRTNSVLKAKNLKKINPQELGFICSNGSINFQSVEAASKYAKNLVMQPLKSKKPYERFVAQHDNIILFQKNGTNYSTMIDDIDTQKILSRFKSDISIVHGHPSLPNSKVASPITPQDCKYIHGNNAFKEIIAYDKQGNFSKLAKKNSNNKLPEKFSQNFEAGIYPKNLMQRQNELLEKMYTSSLTNVEEKEFFDVFNKLQKLATSKQTAKNVHKFWVNNADKLGLEYSTNYSWLV